MFKPTAAMSGKFLDNMKKLDGRNYETAVYEVEYPAIEKTSRLKKGFPYFKSFLSTQEGILLIDVQLKRHHPRTANHLRYRNVGRRQNLDRTFQRSEMDDQIHGRFDKGGGTQTQVQKRRAYSSGISRRSGRVTDTDGRVFADSPV